MQWGEKCGILEKTEKQEKHGRKESGMKDSGTRELIKDGTRGTHMDRKLTAAEQTVIDYISQNEHLVAELTITDIAERAFVSAATVSRAIRKYGYENLTELRYKIASHDKLQPSLTLVNEILSKSYEECIRTLENIRISSILQVAEYIRRSNRIFIIGCGITSLVAQEFEFQLQCQGYNVWSTSDSEMLKRMDKLAHEKDLVFIFSVANSTPELAIAAECSRRQGAKVVVCCCKEHTPLEEFADVFILGHTSVIEPNYVYGSTSRLALQIIMRTIVEYLAV